MIRMTGVTMRLDGRTILDHVTLDVAPGEAVALVGPNGSGKTSILRALLGLMPFSGYAAIDGHDVVREPVAARTVVGYLPQKPAFGDVLAIEAILFAARLRKVPRRRAEEALREAGIEDEAAQRRTKTFSGGMLQRLSLAVALLADPKVLLLDEPTASLDRAGQLAFLDIVTALRQREKTVLLASHRSEEIAVLCDRVIAVEAGHVAEPEREAQPAPALAQVIPIDARRAYR